MGGGGGGGGVGGGVGGGGGGGGKKSRNAPKDSEALFRQLVESSGYYPDCIPDIFNFLSCISISHKEVEKGIKRREKREEEVERELLYVLDKIGEWRKGVGPEGLGIFHKSGSTYDLANPSLLAQESQVQEQQDDENDGIESSSSSSSLAIRKRSAFGRKHCLYVKYKVSYNPEHASVVNRMRPAAASGVGGGMDGGDSVMKLGGGKDWLDYAWEPDREADDYTTVKELWGYYGTSTDAKNNNMKDDEGMIVDDEVETHHPYTRTLTTSPTISSTHSAGSRSHTGSVAGDDADDDSNSSRSSGNLVNYQWPYINIDSPASSYNKFFVGNLPRNISVDELRDAFKKIGSVGDVWLFSERSPVEEHDFTAGAPPPIARNDLLKNVNSAVYTDKVDTDTDNDNDRCKESSSSSSSLMGSREGGGGCTRYV